MKRKLTLLIITIISVFSINISCGYAKEINNIKYANVLTVTEETEVKGTDRVDYNNLCTTNTGTRKAFRIIGYVVLITRWLGPIAIIAFGIMDFTKAVYSSDEDATKKAAKSLGKRLISSIIIFITPTIILALLNILEISDSIEESSSFSACTKCVLDVLNCGSAYAEDEGYSDVTGDEEDISNNNNSKYNSSSAILVDSLDKSLNQNVNFNKNGNILLFGSDYQGAGVKKTNFTNILENINNNNIKPNLIMLLGDYVDSNEQSTSKIGVEEANSVIRSYNNFNNSGTLYLQGNHDSLNLNNYLIKTGPYETDNYIVYAINYGDFHCSANNTCTNLDEYLNSVANSKSNKPIFVVTHIPLHATSRISNKDAYLTVDTLNKYGDKLDIIVMFGHNHSGTYDRCNGGTINYFAKGSTIEYRKNNTVLTDTIKFTYLNAGYVGSASSSFVNGTVKCNGTEKQSSNELTMTLFTINNSSIVVDRYSKNGKVSSNIINRQK